MFLYIVSKFLPNYRSKHPRSVFIATTMRLSNHRYKGVGTVVCT